MRKYTYTKNGFTFERIDKKTAQRAYNNGLAIVVCPCNLRPGAPWFPEIVTSNKDGRTFQEMLNAFIFYNIRDKETGRYPAFYIPVEYVDRFTGEKLKAETMGTVKQYNYKFMEV